jgi:hypothetical protein
MDARPPAWRLVAGGFLGPSALWKLEDKMKSESLGDMLLFPGYK